MTAKQRNHQNQSGRWLLGALLGISLLLTWGNVRTAFNSFSQQSLISLQPDIFPSTKYQPIEFGSSSKIARHDFTELDRIAKNLGYTGSSPQELADLLARHVTTDTEKARIIYAWITQHIAYDVPAFMDAIRNDVYPDVSPKKILRDRTTICSGYSNLYQILAEAMNLKSVIVIGYAKGATPPNDARFQNVNHAWNAVQLEDGWYLLDATWGAGSIRNEKFIANYQPYYFATAPDELINHHFPEDTGWQLLSQHRTRANFDNLPNIAARFYNLGLDLVDHQNYRINTSSRLDLKFNAPKDIVAIAELNQGSQKLAASSVLVNRQNENIVVSVAPPAAGVYDLTIYAKHQDEPGQYGEIIKYQINADNSTTSLPKVYGHFNQYQASLIEPLTAELKPNWSTYFNLIVPEAIDVQVINTETKQWTSLDGYGNYFEGQVEIQPGNTLVIAKFPGDDQYWQLVEYQSRR